VQGWPRVNKKWWEHIVGQQETETLSSNYRGAASKNGTKPWLKPRAEPILWLGLAQLASFGQAGWSRAIAELS